MQDDNKDKIPASPMASENSVATMVPPAEKPVLPPQPANMGGEVPPTTPTAVGSMGEHVPGEPDPNTAGDQADLSQTTVAETPAEPSQN